jgi:tRNA dimethylallyltransferase
MRGGRVNPQPSDIRLLAIVGPTAVGKTDLALRIARQVAAEAVSADSRQIYRLMDIGTAKATVAEREILPHHLINIVDPDDTLTLAQFLALAKAAIAAIHARGGLPILVGGTGLYVRALLEGWTVPEAPPDEAFRQRMYQLSEAEGATALSQRLAEVDPEAAANIDARNVRRVIRALEVHHLTGQPISELQRKRPPGYDVWTIGLTCSRERLYARIDDRLERMLAAGLEQEVRELLARGYDPALPSMSGLGYRQMAAYLAGETTLAEAVQQIKRDTRRFVRQQYNWFRLSAGWITWYDVTAVNPKRIAAKAVAFARTGERAQKAQD